MSTTAPIAQFSNFNGIDFTSIVTALMQQDSVPLTNLQNQLSNYQTQGSALKQLGTYMTTMESDVQNLSDPAVFSSVQASSSDSTTVNATASSTSSSSGSYNVNVTALARAQVTASTAGFASTSTTVADGGSISFTINGTTTSPINVSAATTLTQLRDTINQQNLGVTASIVNTGSTNLLVISGSQTGASTGFTINNSLSNSGGATVAFASGQSPTVGNMQTAQNAALTVNGIAVTSSSNTVTGAIPGVSLTLSKTGSAAVNVTPSYTSAESAIDALVTDYNDIQLYYGSQETTDSNGNPMPLDNDPALRQTMNNLSAFFSQSVSNGSGFSNMAQLGIQFDQDGSLSFDKPTFEAAVAANPGGAQQFLQGTGGSGGMMATLQSTLQALDPVTGLISTEQTGLKQTETQTQTEIASEQVRLAQEQKSLQAKYTAADTLMTQLNSMTSAISALGSSLSSSSSSSSKSLTSKVN